MSRVRLDDRVRFPPNLPITQHVDDIAAALDQHQVIVVAGETGSGKTTQLPKVCLAMGRGDRARIACTQPRRIAATSIAARVAHELDTQLGEVVGFKIRFDDRVRPATRIKFLTDGMLLAEIQGDALLREYDTIIVDEAHERSLNIDFLLGFLLQLLPRRPELRVIVSSATLDTERFSQFFGDAPIISVSGRTFPVDVLYRPPRDDETDLADTVANAVNEVTELDPHNDVLVFLPGEREIRETAGELEQRALPHTVVLPLYARLPAADQQRVFQASSQRRVVLATNVAETSLTIPGIVYVVDAGVARINRYNWRTGVTQLLVEPVSRASADQRKGRCGRTESGVCFRLYEERDFDTRPPYTDPEIRRVGLAGVILRMKSLRMGDVEAFPFLDPPNKRALDEGYRVLEELGALAPDGELTAIGAQLARLPIDPRLGRMILGARDEGALREVVVIAAALGLQDPRERPHGAQQQADEAHRKFRVEGSDFLGYLELWKLWEGARTRSRRQLYKLCRDHFLSYVRMREWDEIHAQLVRTLRELDFRPNDTPATTEQIHRALLLGLLSKIGMWNPEARVYVGARHTRFVIHPSSALARKPPPWVMAAELVETSQLFARSVARVDPAWIERAAGALCKRSHGDPHWEQKAAQVVAKEQVTLYGLPIVKDRKVAFAAIDPALCRELFITHALVRQEYDTRGAFQEHNRRLLDEVRYACDKARRSDIAADESALYEFFDRRIPDDVCSGKTFEAWRKGGESLLELSRHDILLDDGELSPARYPDHVVVRGVTLPLAYRFEPSEDDDGATATVPLAVLPQLDPDELAWTIPGWHEDKLRALLGSLPKAIRKALAQTAPIDDLARQLAAALQPFAGPMLATVERAILERTGERVPRDAWDVGALPAYLSLAFRVVDDHDKTLGHGRDLGELQRSLGRRAKEVWAIPRERYERTGLRGWDFDALPASVTIDLAGRAMRAFPAVVDNETSVDVRLLESEAAAHAATRDGLRRLFLLQMNTTPKRLEDPLPAAIARGPLAVAGSSPARQIVMRALDEAFRLADHAATPRSKAAFVERLHEGRTALPAVMKKLELAAVDVGSELATVRTWCGRLAGRPGPTRAALDDVRDQLAHVVPPTVMEATPIDRFGHVARYLRAIGIRLQRLELDPQKDQQKAAHIAPLWIDYQRKVRELTSRKLALPELVEFGWLLEELRVQTFAPELKTAVPVSAQRLQSLWASIGRR